MGGQGRRSVLDLANDPVAEGMEGQRIDLCTGALLDPCRHLRGGAFAEGHEKDILRLSDAALDQVGRLRDYDAGLSRSRTRENKCGVFIGDDSLALLWRERVCFDRVEEAFHLHELGIDK